MKSNKSIRGFISIRKRLLIIVVSFVGILLFLLWFFNMLLTSNVYRRVKIGTMEEVFEQLDEASLTYELYSSNYERVVEQISFHNNIGVVVMSHNGSILLSGGEDDNKTMIRLMDALLSDKNKDNLIVHTDAYDVLLDEDEYLNEKYYVLVGTLSDGNIIMLRYSVESMRLTIEVFNETLIIVAVIAFVLVFVLAEIFTRRLTKPIIELTEISKKMSELDFGVKFRSRNRKTEIDILGEHMNEMSLELEKVYTDLRKANIELKKDIAIKEKNEEMRNEFLSNVAHELKTPIALIQGYAEGLSEGMADEPESREYYCDVIVDEADKMNKMVGRLIALNELEFNDKAIDNEEFNITELIKGVVLASNILIEQEGIIVEYDIDTDINVVCDASYVEMAFSNYLSNAIHYCKNDKIIRISQLDKGDRVCISVYNSGDNIPEDAMPRLWEKFYKVDKARTREYGGSGVGLSIVRLAITSLGGKYGVYNSDTGVTFWFEINK